MRVSLTNGRDGFSVEPGQSVLDAALAAGLNLPHSCKGGNCGSCLARLLRGDIAYPNGRPLGISDAEAAEGLILLCQARARSDLLVETRETHLAGESRVKRLPCRIESAEQVSHDVAKLLLRLPAAEDFPFEAGQYVDVMLSGGRRRSFSIASPPHDSRPLELHVRRVSGGEFTETVFGGSARNTLLTIEGPLGQFVYRPSAAPMLLIGGGTGLAPLNSIIRHVLENRLPRELTLYWGVRGERDLYADASLRALAARPGALRYVPVLSEPPPHWTGRTGLVHEAALSDTPDPAACDVYAAGPPAMVAAVRRTFQERGLAQSRVFFDSFDYAPDALARQPSSAATKS
jgi:CDP-4-dehydro-6-deoxyglucose reductase